MFVVHEDMTIYATRGDVVYFPVEKKQGSMKYLFQPGDIVRIKVCEKKNYSKVLLLKDFVVEEETTSVNIFLDKWEMKFGEIINKPTDYWYEVELNPDTYPDTFIGHNENGAAVFKLFPEMKDVVEGEITDPKEESAVQRMVVTFVTEYLGELSETVIKELLEKEILEIIVSEIIKDEHLETIIQEMLKEDHLETIIQEIIKKENLETIIQEILEKEYLDTIIQEIIQGENLETIIQEIIKPENSTVIVEQVLDQLTEHLIKEGLKGATFTPKVDAEGNLSWTNDGDLENPAVVNITGPKGDPGDTPVKGRDYFTEAEKQEMIEAVIAAITDLDEVSY